MRNHVILDSLKVGYDGTCVVDGIDVSFLRGRMTCLLGPNGSGKTTILRTVARLLTPLGGVIELNGKQVEAYNTRDFARHVAVVLTQRLDLHDMIGYEVTAMGRHPHTGFWGVLGELDKQIVEESLYICGASHLAERSFNTLSDGQKQKILIARAIAQEPKVLLLDEPTSHLDIRYKVEILSMLKRLCLMKGITVILTLHEPDLAIKSCDSLVLIRDNRVLASGPVDDVAQGKLFSELYGLQSGFNPLTCGVEFPALAEPDVFVVPGGGTGTSIYRLCARIAKGFSTGIVHENDLDYFTAKDMGAKIWVNHAFATIDDSLVATAFEDALSHKLVVDTGFPVGEMNRGNVSLLKMLINKGAKVISLRQSPLEGAINCHSLSDLEAILNSGEE